MQRRELEGFDEYFIADDGSIYHNNRKLKTTLDMVVNRIVRGMTYTETELCNE